VEPENVIFFVLNIVVAASESNHSISGKGTAIPLLTWKGSEVSSRLKFPDFMTIGT
jgi:hypothetical protein